MTSVQRQILISQVSRKRSEINEKSLNRELTRFFEKLKKEVLKELEENWKEYQMLQKDMDLVCAPIHESHKTYYELIRKHVEKEYKNGYKRGERLVKLATKQQEALKAQVLPIQAFIQKDDLFKPMEYAEDALFNDVFIASERTLVRVDEQINAYLSTGYKTGKGIDYVGKQITRRFDQLKDWESRRIARTEIHKAHNVGTMRAYGDLGVRYTQWDCSIDGRERDSHRDLDGEIIEMGYTYSNGLKFPGDSSSGLLKEFINCRCGNLPFIIPYDKIAPPGLKRFRESDLVSIKVQDFEEVIARGFQKREFTSDYVNNVMADARRSIEAWDINRLPPGEREYYLKLKKNYTILFDAVSNKNYADLDKLEDFGGFYVFRDKASFMEWTDNLTDFHEVYNEMDDLLEDILEFEDIIKNRNIAVTETTAPINWHNDELFEDFKNLTENYTLEEFDTSERFIVYRFKDIDLTIYESKDMTNSRVRALYKEYKSLPEHFRNASEVILSNQSPVMGLDRLGGYVLDVPGFNRIYQFRAPVTTVKKTLRHELVHLLEKDDDFFLSNSKEYIQAFYKDRNALLAKGLDLEETYITKYAYDFTETALSGGFGKERAFSEDLAESVKMYLHNKEAFIKKYPEKSKFIERMLKNELKPRHVTNYKVWRSENYTKYDLTEEEFERYTELGITKHIQATKGKPLSKAEAKELQYYEDRRTYSYLHKKIMDNEILPDNEMEEYLRLQKKLGYKPIQVINEMEYSPRVKMRKEIIDSEKDLFKLTPSEEKELTEAYDQLHDHYDEMGLLTRSALEDKIENLSAKKYYNHLRNLVIDRKFEEVNWEDLERLHAQFKYYKTANELKKFDNYKIKVTSKFSKIQGFKLTPEEQEIHDILKNNPLNIQTKQKKLLIELKDKKRLGELHEKMLDLDYYEHSGHLDLAGLSEKETREYFELYKKYQTKWGLPDVDFELIHPLINAPSYDEVSYYMPSNVPMKYVTAIDFNETVELDILRAKKFAFNSLTEAETERFEYLIAKRDFNKIYSLKEYQQGLFYKERKLYYKLYHTLSRHGEFDGYDVGELINKFEIIDGKTYSPSIKWKEVSPSKYKIRKGAYDTGMPFRVTDLNKLFTLDVRNCTIFENDLSQDWLAADYRKFREFNVICKGSVPDYIDFLMQEHQYSKNVAFNKAMEAAYNTTKLANLCNNQTKEAMTLWRCETKLHLGDNPEIGDVVTFEGFNSTAITKEGMLYFKEHSRKTITAIVEIEAPVGTRGAYLAPIAPTQFKPEMELLLQINTKAKIVDIGKTTIDGKTYDYAKVRIVNDYGFDEVLHSSDIGLKLR